ncbi:MAG: 50S ribosomal protein L6 [Lentisphaerae bacterium]|nr:50S ribosomal protein L6 [Lentisphaerota bacterium]
MSRVGKRPITIPPGVEVQLAGSLVSVSGPKGTLKLNLPDGFQVQIDGAQLQVAPTHPGPNSSARYGLYRSLLANMITGVARGYVKELEIQGVGFKAAVQGQQAVFALGFSSPAILAIPPGIEMKVNDNVNVTISGPDKQQVGNFAAGIKALFPAEPYKGKGIRFKGEHVRRKAGKTVA